MELDGLLRHFFGPGDPAALADADFAAAVERIEIAFGVEREPGRRFALWALLDALGAAPPPAAAFARDPALMAAADDYLRAAGRLERGQGGR